MTIKKSKRKRFFKRLITCLLPASSLVGGFYEEPCYQGFYYFEEFEGKDKESQTPKKHTAPQTPEEAIIFINLQKERLEGLQALAISNPTTANLFKYFEQRNFFIDMASDFSEKGELALLERPDLGPDPKFPLSSFGIEFRKNLEDAQEQEEIKALGKRFFLIVVGEGGEPWSELAASIGETFANATKWTVRFLSLNGEKTFSDIKTEFNYSILKETQIVETPTFLMACPESGKMIPVGSGAPSISSLMEAIILQAKNHFLLESVDES